MAHSGVQRSLGDDDIASVGVACLPCDDDEPAAKRSGRAPAFFRRHQQRGLMLLYVTLCSLALLWHAQRGATEHRVVGIDDEPG